MKYNAGIEIGREKDWLNLHRNENLFVEGQVMQDIIADVVKNTIIQQYPDPYASALRQRLALWHNVSPDNIFVGNGADEVLSALFYTFRKRYDTVNFPRVSFKMYDILAEKFGFAINQFEGFPNSAAAAISDLSGFTIIDSPGSITGEVIDEKLISTLANTKGNVVVWDNVHGDFSGDIPQGVNDNLIIIRHFSHYFALAGLRIGYCIASLEVVQAMNNFREPFNVNSVAQGAAKACLDKAELFDEAARQMFNAKRVFEQELRQLAFELSDSRANYVLIKHPHEAGISIYKKLLDKKIATRYYPEDPILKDHLRIAVPPMKEIDRVIAALA